MGRWVGHIYSTPTVKFISHRYVVGDCCTEGGVEQKHCAGGLGWGGVCRTTDYQM